MAEENEITVQVLVARQLGLEIQRIEATLVTADARIERLQTQYDSLRNPDPDAPLTSEEDQVSTALIRAIHHGSTISERLAVLRSPSELERRINEKLANQQSLRRLIMSETETTTETPKVKKPTPADQGVPAQYLNDDGSKFLTGMDARLKSDLIASITGEITTAEPGASKHVFDEETARSILEARDWTGFLDRKLAILETKAAKKAEAAKAREVREREQAEAKAKKAADAAEAKAAKAAEGGGTATASGAKSGGTSKTDQARIQREAKAAAAA